MAEKKTTVANTARQTNSKTQAAKKRTSTKNVIAENTRKKASATKPIVPNTLNRAVTTAPTDKTGNTTPGTIEDAVPSSTANNTHKNTHGTPVLSAGILWNLWLDGWKKTLVLRGRSSRFELWCWLLPNTILCTIIQLFCAYILSPRFLRTANQLGYTIELIESFITTAQIIFYLVMIVSLFPLGSLLIRRMHDLNRLAWKNYLEPVFTGAVVFSALNFAIILLSNTAYAYTILLLGICMVAIFYGICFHMSKFLIMVLFYRGNIGHNLYGSPKYKSDEYEEPALNLSCIYFLFITTIGALYLALALI